MKRQVKGVRRGRRTEAEVAREAAGLSREQLAARVRLAPSTIRHYERYGTDCEVTARQMARAVGCSMDVYLHPRAV